MVPSIGDVIADKYRIERRLGGGGMGTVFSATHLMTGRRFAIKWMNTRSGHDNAARERFIREFQVAGSIDHPNVVAVLDVGSHDGTLYIVMEYLEGESLGKMISRGPMAPSDCVPIVVEAMRGVAAAHRLDIVHRDLKPDNIFVCASDRAGLTVKVLDFGVMKPVNERAQSLPTITARGMAVGTPPYMAPEQVLALASLDHRVDIYSFGVILYEALSGRLPYADVTGLLLLERIVRGGPPPLSQFAPGVPIGLEATVMRALSRDPRRRFQRLADFAACLQPWAAGAGAFGTLAPAARRVVARPDVDVAEKPSEPEADSDRPELLDVAPPAATPVVTEPDADSARPELVDVAPPTPAPAPVVPAVSTAKPAEEKSSRRGRKRKKRRRREREREAKAAAAAAAASAPVPVEAVEAPSAAKPEQDEGSATPAPDGAEAATPEPAEASSNAAQPSDAGARSRRDSVPEPRAELPIEVALRRALAREGRLPLRHAWNGPEAEASATPANDSGGGDAFADLKRDSAVPAVLTAAPAAHNDQLGSRPDSSVPEDGDARRSRVPTLPLKLQDIEALRAAFQVRRDDSETSPESAITSEMVAPRPTRISMHELSPWPAPPEETRDSWSAPTEMAFPAPRMPAMRNRGGWGLVGIATIVVCGIAWTQWDPEEDAMETEQSVSAASDIFASDPHDPFAELAPSLADPPRRPERDDPAYDSSKDPPAGYDLARSRAASNYEYPSSIDLPDAPPAAPSGPADVEVATVAAAESLPMPSPAPQGFAPEQSAEPAPTADALARGPTEPPSAPSAPQAVDHDIASAPAPATVSPAAASAAPASEALPETAEASAAPPAAPGKVVVVPAIDAMGTPEPAAQAAMNGSHGTSASSTPATAGTPTPPTSASQASTPAWSDARGVTASAAAPAPPAQPVEGHPAVARHDAVLLAPARAPEGQPEKATTTAVAPPAAAANGAPFESVFASPAPVVPATEAPAAPTQPKPAPQVKPSTPNAQTQPAARNNAAPAAQTKPNAQSKSTTPASPAAKPSATVTVTKLDMGSPNAAQPRAKPNGATVDVPSSAARSGGEGKSPPPRKTSGVSVADF